MARWRSCFRSLCAVVVLLVTRFAAASPEPPAITAAPRAVSHEGSADGEQIAWHTTLEDITWMGDAPSSIARITLAAPLPHGSALVSSSPPGARASYDGKGDIDAIELRAASAPGAFPRLVTIDTTQPLASRDAVLAPPIVAGSAPNVITLSGPEGRRFEPAADLALVRHVGFLATDDVDADARRACARLTGARTLPLDAEPIYLLGTSRIVGHVHGRVATQDERNRPGIFGAAIAFLASAIILVLLYRRLASSAEVERADAAIRAEYESPGSRS